MILTSFKNFIATYAKIIQLVFVEEKKQLVLIVSLYLISVGLLGSVFLMMLAMLKTTILLSDFDLSKLIVLGFSTYTISLSKLVLGSILLALYLLSSAGMYVVEKIWHKTIAKIVKKLVNDSVNKHVKEIRVGAIATIRVSAILLAVLLPSLTVIFTFVFLVFLDFKMALITLLIASVGIYSYLHVGRKTKQISYGILDDEDFDARARTSTTSVVERITFVSNLLQLKAKSKFIANFMFIMLIVGIVYYFQSMSPDTDGAYKILVSFGLIYLCVNGMKSVGSKAVPLSRQYNLVKNFISVTE